MAAYLIADVKVIDDAWVSDYLANVPNIVHKHDGKYLFRGGNITTVEGEELDTTAFSMLEFPSMVAARAFLDDPDYKEYGQARQAGSISRYYLIDDIDVVGAIPYLPKG